MAFEIRKVSIFFVLAVIHCFAMCLHGQTINEFRPTNSINANILGDASLISLNYEKLISNSEHSFFAINAGIGTTAELLGSREYGTIPHRVTFNIGSDRHFFEAGVGGNVILDQHLKGIYVVYPVFGYRFQPTSWNKLNLRLFISYPLGNPNHVHPAIFTPGGLSVGYCF